MTPDDKARFITPTTKSARLHHPRHTLTRVCRGISIEITSVYMWAQAWVTEQHVGDNICRAIQKSVARLHAAPWQALALQYRPVLLGLGVLLLLLTI
jgi:hypothetical protein